MTAPDAGQVRMAHLEGNQVMNAFLDVYLEGMGAGAMATTRALAPDLDQADALAGVQRFVDRTADDPLVLEEIRQVIGRVLRDAAQEAGQ